MTDLKTVLVDALRDACPDEVSLDGTTIIIEGPTTQNYTFVPIDADRLAKAVTDHFTTALTNIHGDVIRHAFLEAMLVDKALNLGCDRNGRLFKDGVELKTDQMVHVFTDRLIAGLTGGSE